MKLFKRHFKCPASINASNTFVIVDNYIYSQDAKLVFMGARGDNCCCTAINENYAIVVYESSFESPTEIMLVDLHLMQVQTVVELPNVSWVSDCKLIDGVAKLLDDKGNFLHIDLTAAPHQIKNLGKLVEGNAPYTYCFPSDRDLIAVQTDKFISLMNSNKKCLSKIPKVHDGLFDWAAGNTYSAYTTSKKPELHILDFRNKNLVVTHKLPENVTAIAVYNKLICVGLCNGQIFLKDMSKSASELIHIPSYSTTAVDKIVVTGKQIFALFGNAIIAYDIPA